MHVARLVEFSLYGFIMHSSDPFMKFDSVIAQDMPPPNGRLPAGCGKRAPPS